MSDAGKVRASYPKSGSPTYSIEIWHNDLGKHKEIRSRNKAEVQARATEWMKKWDLEWQKGLKAKRADAKTKEAKEALSAVENILEHTLDVDDAINFDRLRDTSKFSVRKPERPALPKRGFLTSFIASKQAKYEDKVSQMESEYQKELRQWEQDREKFKEAQAKHNQKVANFERNYLDGNLDSLAEYCNLVLERSRYPESFPKQFELNYNSENQILVVDYELPVPDNIPTLEKVTYIKSKDEFKEKHIAKAKHAKLYDDVVYQMAIRTIHELYEADRISKLASIVFNGFVNTMDPSTGAGITPCILSVQANKEEFDSLILENVEPKAAFRRLKGVGSSKLHSLAPVAPLLRFDKSDTRFVEPYGVVGDLGEEDNLAAMDWEDFEHLIREVFEKEFSSNGGEVKITQASRDRGVDAVAFDPDPIRGGKIVIQAKRYTNTVGVDAVRDLYGTVINEGAGKGILVTTSDYGPDAYQFAKGKPIVLLNGGNLLHLLEKHGHKARIDTAEAKRILAERDRLARG